MQVKIHYVKSQRRRNQFALIEQKSEYSKKPFFSLKSDLIQLILYITRKYLKWLYLYFLSLLLFFAYVEIYIAKFIYST